MEKILNLRKNHEQNEFVVVEIKYFLKRENKLIESENNIHICTGSHIPTSDRRDMISNHG